MRESLILEGYLDSSILWDGLKPLGNSEYLWVPDILSDLWWEKLTWISVWKENSSLNVIYSKIQTTHCGRTSRLLLCCLFVEGHAFVLFLWFTFRFSSILLKSSLVDSSFNMGKCCPFASSLRINFSPEDHTFPLCFFHVKTSGLICSISTTMCFSSVSYPYSFQTSPTPCWNHL